MGQTCKRGLATVPLLLALVVPSTAKADLLPGWFHHDPECPPGYYSCLHYLTPDLYYWRSRCHPVSLDQYPAGPCPPVAPHYRFEGHRCPYAEPMPMAPYADPEAYFGRPPQGSTAQPEQKKTFYP